MAEASVPRCPPALLKMTGYPLRRKIRSFLENYFAIFRNPPTPNASKLMKSRIFFHRRYLYAPRHCRRWPRVLPKTKNPYFLENYFTIFRNPPTPNALKLMKSRKFFTHFEKNIEILMNFHQNQSEKRRIWYKNVDFFFRKISKFSCEFLQQFWVSTGAKECRSCRSRKMLQNGTLVAKIGFDTEENEPAKVSRK